MHFPLIKFEKIDTPVDEWDIDADPESISLQANTEMATFLMNRGKRLGRNVKRSARNDKTIT